jgi:hypothetical protein
MDDNHMHRLMWLAEVRMSLTQPIEDAVASLKAGEDDEFWDALGRVRGGRRLKA